MFQSREALLEHRVIWEHSSNLCGLVLFKFFLHYNFLLAKVMPVISIYCLLNGDMVLKEVYMIPTYLSTFKIERLLVIYC